MAIKESLLTVVNSISDSDFVRAVTSAGASRKLSVSNLAKHIVETYTGSTIAGSAQSVKSALDALVEKDYPAKSSLTTNDYIRVVGTDNVSYKQRIYDVKTAMGLQYYSIAKQASITLDYAAATRALVTFIGGVSATRGQYIVAGYSNTLEWRAVLEATGVTLTKSGTRSLTITNTSNYSMDVSVMVFAGSVTQQ